MESNFSKFWRLEIWYWFHCVKTKCRQSHTSLHRCQGRICSLSLLLLAAAGILWLGQLCPSELCLCGYIAFSSVCQVSLCVCLVRIHVIAFIDHLANTTLSASQGLQLDHFYKIILWNIRPPLWIPGIRSGCHVWGPL